MQLDTPKNSTRVAAIMRAVQERIAARALTRGDKLPSIRAMAEAMGVSASTVVNAYDRLVADGIIESRPGSGFYVATETAPLSLAEIGNKHKREIDPLWVSRQSLESEHGALRPGCGWLPESWLPQRSIRAALRAVARDDDAALAEYATPLGRLELRRLLVRRLSERNVYAPPSQILLTDSGTHAIDLLCRFFLEPGDTVLVDDPCYFNFHALLRAHRVKVVGVSYTPSGPDIECFERVVAQERPRLYITNSGLQNPTGAILSPIAAHHVLRLAQDAGLTIIEDDIYADFEHAPAPRLAAFDGFKRVVYIGSFSKTLSASIRCGFIAAKPEWIDALTDLKIATTFGGGRLNADVLFRSLRDGGYRKHLERLRLRLSVARNDVAQRLEQMGVELWMRPEAGMFLWCRLPEGVDAADLARDALAHNIVLAPGNVFSLSQSATGLMRFNVAQSQDERLFAYLQAYLGDGRVSRNKP